MTQAEIAKEFRISLTALKLTFQCLYGMPIETYLRTVDWAVRHGMYAYDAPDPFGYIKKLDDFKMTDIGPHLTQDTGVYQSGGSV